MPRKKETRGRKPLALTPVKKKKHNMELNNLWRKNHSRCINVRYNLEHDAEILAKLDSVPNKADYIRQLILEDIRKNDE